jgi:hypothetical protein
MDKNGTSDPFVRLEYLPSPPKIHYDESMKIRGNSSAGRRDRLGRSKGGHTADDDESTLTAMSRSVEGAVNTAVQPALNAVNAIDEKFAVTQTGKQVVQSIKDVQMVRKISSGVRNLVGDILTVLAILYSPYCTVLAILHCTSHTVLAILHCTHHTVLAILHCTRHTALYSPYCTRHTALYLPYCTRHTALYSPYCTHHTVFTILHLLYLYHTPFTILALPYPYTRCEMRPPTYTT